MTSSSSSSGSGTTLALVEDERQTLSGPPGAAWQEGHSSAAGADKVHEVIMQFADDCTGKLPLARVPEFLACLGHSPSRAGAVARTLRARMGRSGLVAAGIPAAKSSKSSPRVRANAVGASRCPSLVSGGDPLRENGAGSLPVVSFEAVVWTLQEIEDSEAASAASQPEPALAPGIGRPSPRRSQDAVGGGPSEEPLQGRPVPGPRLLDGLLRAQDLQLQGLARRWDGYVQDYKATVAAMQADLQARHAAELEDLRAKVQRVTASMPAPHPSVKVLELRRAHATLARMGRENEALQCKAAAEMIEKEDAAASMSRWSLGGKKVEEQLLEKHKKELDDLTRTVQRDRELQDRQRAKDMEFVRQRNKHATANMHRRQKQRTREALSDAVVDVWKPEKLSPRKHRVPKASQVGALPPVVKRRVAVAQKMPVMNNFNGVEEALITFFASSRVSAEVARRSSESRDSHRLV